MQGMAVCAKEKIQTVSERKWDELYEDIWYIKVAESIHKVVLSEHRQKNQICPNFTVCAASHYRNSSTSLG